MESTYLPQRSEVKLIECPRDAMQGWRHFIPTDKKINYLNSLLKVGFDTIDFGSFVSPKAIPQMADTREVVKNLEMHSSSSKLLAIVANTRGADEAAEYDQITYLGFPFSVSPTFQQRNTNSTPQQSLITVEEIQNLCIQNNKQLVIYLSMAFGNPYGDSYDADVLLQWADEIARRNITIISLADTVGIATPRQVQTALEILVPKYKNIQFGVHLHSTSTNWREKTNAAYNAGCRRFDGALKGIGGCPLAGDDLVGNMNTEWLLNFMESKEGHSLIDKEALQKSLKLADEIFM